MRIKTCFIYIVLFNFYFLHSGKDELLSELKNYSEFSGIIPSGENSLSQPSVIINNYVHDAISDSSFINSIMRTCWSHKWKLSFVLALIGYKLFGPATRADLDNSLTGLKEKHTRDLKELNEGVTKYSTKQIGELARRVLKDYKGLGELVVSIDKECSTGFGIISGRIDTIEKQTQKQENSFKEEIKKPANELMHSNNGFIEGLKENLKKSKEADKKQFATINPILAQISTAVSEAVKKTEDTRVAFDNRLDSIGGRLEGLESTIENILYELQNLRDENFGSAKILLKKVKNINKELERRKNNSRPTNQLDVKKKSIAN